jgi:Flp pilus assembly protein TadG
MRGMDKRCRTVTLRREKGAAMVEMGIVVALFLLIVLGIAEFGSAFMVTQAVVSAARDGARTAAVTPTLAVNDGRVAAVAFERLRPVGLCDSPTVTNNKPVGVGDAVRVRVSCQYRLITQVSWFNQLQGITINREAVMYWEG